jgi:hypothetical protein
MVVITLAALWGGYLLAMNVFIRTRLFPNVIDADPGSLLVEYASAYSIVPGRIHVQDLRIRGRDSNVEWILVIDRCDFRVSFGDLLHRRFHANDVHGDGLSLRLRLRQPSFTPEHVSALPPVPGFSDPPYSGVKPPPLSDADYDLWTIWLEGVVAEHVREIWVDTIRFSGDFDVRGRWYFKPVRWLDMGPATIDARALDVSYGMAEPWVTGTSGRLVATVYPSDVRLYEGANVLDEVSVSGDLAGTLHGAGPFRHVAIGGKVAVEQADGPFTVHADVDRGVLRPGTRAAAGPLPLRARGFDLELAAGLRAEARVDPDGVGRAVVDATTVDVSQGSFSRATLQRLVLAAHARNLDLADPFGDAAYAADVEELATDSLRYWGARAPVAPRLVVDSGSVSVSAHIEGALREPTMRARAHLAVCALSLAAGGTAMKGDLVADVEAMADPPERRVSLSRSRIVANGVRMESGRAAVLVPEATLASSDIVVTPGEVRGRAVVDAPEVEVPDVGELARLLPLPAMVRVVGGRARGQVHLRIDLGERVAEGTAQVLARGVTVHVGSRRSLRGDLTVALSARARDNVTDVSGSTVRFQEAQEDGWWADAQLREARLEGRGGPSLRAHVSLRAKDASPVTALLRDQAGLPEQLALGLVSTSGLSAEGELVLTPRVLEARSVIASADGFDMRLELATLGRQRTVAVFVVAGPLRVGVDVVNDATKVMLFGAEPWFATRVASIRDEEKRGD